MEVDEGPVDFGNGVEEVVPEGVVRSALYHFAISTEIQRHGYVTLSAVVCTWVMPCDFVYRIWSEEFLCDLELFSADWRVPLAGHYGNGERVGHHLQIISSAVPFLSVRQCDSLPRILIAFDYQASRDCGNDWSIDPRSRS